MCASLDVSARRQFCAVIADPKQSDRNCGTAEQGPKIQGARWKRFDGHKLRTVNSSPNTVCGRSTKQTKEMNEARFAALDERANGHDFFDYDPKGAIMSDLIQVGVGWIVLNV